MKCTPQVGMPVWWYPGGDRNQEPLPATITGVGHRTLCLHVLSKELKNFLIKDGVRHLDDDDAKKPELQEQGAWDYASWWKNLLEGKEAPLADPKKK